MRWETTCHNIRVRLLINSRHPISSILKHRFSLQSIADLSATRELEYLLSRLWSIGLLPEFRTGRATTSFGVRTFLSGQTKRACNTTALRRISVDVSPSTSVEVVELIVTVQIIGHSFRHTRHRLIYSCGVSVEEFECQEKLRTADEISRRIMNGAVIARRDQKQTENLRSQPSIFEYEVDEVLNPYHY